MHSNLEFVILEDSIEFLMLLKKRIELTHGNVSAFSEIGPCLKKLLETQRSKSDVILISDYNIKTENSEIIFEALLSEKIKLRSIILISGSAHIHKVFKKYHPKFMEIGTSFFLLPKPFSLKDLSLLIDRATQYASAAKAQWLARQGKSIDKLYAINFGALIFEARKNLGLSRNNVVRLLEQKKYYMSPSDLKKIESSEKEMAAVEWLSLCEVLYLDSMTYIEGYKKLEHLKSIKHLIETNALGFKPSKKLVLSLKLLEAHSPSDDAFQSEKSEEEC